MNNIEIKEQDIINAIPMKNFIEFYENELEENEKQKFFKTITDSLYDCYCDNCNIGIKIGDKVFWEIFMIKGIDYIYIKDIITDKIYFQEIN